jgi:hypothetical protein
LLLLATLLVTLPAIGARPIDLILALLPVAIACAGMAAVVYALDSVLPGLSAPLHLGILALAGATTYFAMLWFLWPDILRSAWAMLRKPKAS